MSKTFIELFNKYLPTDEHAAILDGAEIVRSRVDKEKRMIEVTVSFFKLVSKRKLYEIEDAVCQAYKIQFCKILPQYPKELFDVDYIPEILLEAERVGIVAKGFFGNYEYTCDENELCIRIPFVQDGISLLERADTPRVIEKIIESEFGIRLSVRIEHDANISSENSDVYREKLAEIDRQILNAEKRYTESSFSHGTNNITSDLIPTERIY